MFACLSRSSNVRHNPRRQPGRYAIRGCQVPCLGKALYPFPLSPSLLSQIVEEFWRCGSCGKVFWMGPKSASAIQLVGGMLARVRQEGEDAGHSFFNDGYPNTSTNGPTDVGTGGADNGDN